jgi:hypothetical protein
MSLRCFELSSSNATSLKKPEYCFGMILVFVCCRPYQLLGKVPACRCGKV